MKLKFERFEGLTSFSVRGTVIAPEMKILQVGLESLVKELESPLVVNLVLAKIPDTLVPVFLALKKSLPAQSKHKIHWISPVKNVGDFPKLHAFISRLTGFKHRQIGERLILDDEVFELQDQIAVLQARLAQTSGDESKAHELILQNQTLKVQERILKNTIHFQKERIKNQSHIPSTDEELQQKMAAAKEEITKVFGVDL